MAQNPIYVIKNTNGGTLGRPDLEKVLEQIPLSIEISKGHKLPLTYRFETEKDPTEEPILLVTHSAQVISLRPEKGKRLSDGSLLDPENLFRASRIMDESTGGGACSSYHFNTAKLGFPFNYDMCLDIYKLG